MFEEYTFENILERMLNRVSDDTDKREGSVIYDALAPAAVELQLMYIELDNMLRQCFADTADRTYLVLRAKERGLEPYPATAAVLRGVFEPADIDVEGKRFNLGSLNYVAGELLEDGSRAVYCETPGADGNLYFGSLLPLEYIEGLRSAYLTGIITEGSDEEDTEAFRSRYLESLNSQAFGGNVADYKQKIRELNTNEDIAALGGIGQIRIYSADEWNGGGTVKAVITARDNGVAATSLVSAVQEYLDPVENTGKGLGIAPVGHIVTVASVAEQQVNVSVSLTVKEGYTKELLTPYITQAVEDCFQELNGTWEDLYEGGDDCISIMVSYLAGLIQAVTGVSGITDIDVGGAVFGGSLVLNKDCLAKLGTLNVEVAE